MKVDNVSLGTSEKEIKEFFSFSGDIECVEMQRNEGSQVAYVTFRDTRGAETALLLKGVTILDHSIGITSVLAGPNVNRVEEYKDVGDSLSAIQKAKDIIGSMFMKGFLSGKDALSRAKAFAKKHQLMSTASAKVSSLEREVRLFDKISRGASVLRDTVNEMEQKFQVSEKAKSAFVAAQQKVVNASSGIFKE